MIRRGLIKPINPLIGKGGWKGLRKSVPTLKSLSLSTSAATLPTQARVVIVGGGIIGNSIAYHLAKGGMKDVVLLEQSQVTAGTTWHAAGLMVTFGSTSETSTEIRKYTKELYSTLEAETGQSTGFKPVGFIELATEPDRLEEYRRVAAINRKFGVDVQEIGPKDVASLFPYCRTDDILSGFYVKDDGRVNPIDACMAFNKGARMYGARVIEGVHVTGVTTTVDQSKMNKKVTGVTTSTGEHIACEYVVNAAGMWARQFAEQCGVVAANQAAEHYYLITDKIDGVDPSWPVVEDPANYTYIRPEGAGLMVGLFEGEGAAWNVNKIPDTFSYGEITPDWDRLGPYLQAAMSRVPISETVGVKKFFCGPESFCPDLQPMIGEVPEIRNYFMAAGLNSIGILSGGGIGRLVAQWIIDGKPDMDITAFNVDRLHKFQSTPEYRRDRVQETLGMVYKCHYPYKSKETARGTKRSPFYPALRDKGAYFKDVSGWEGADWFAPPPSSPGGEVRNKIEKQSWGRQHWFEYWQHEHKACREGVVLMDMSFMAKFLVMGRDAGKCLNRLCTANVDPKDTSNIITYTQWLNDSGTLEADVTVTKEAEDRFMVIATDTMHRHAETWARRNLDPEGKHHVFIHDVTGAYSQLNIQGPKSRALLQKLTDTDMSDAAFPFRTAKQISIGYAPVLCCRITYVGELGYELHIPTEFAQHVYERVVKEGESVGLVHAGLKALASLRMEKAYKDYGHDLDNLDTLLEVGLGFTADTTKEGGFIGMPTVLAQRKELKEKGGLKRRLVHLLCLDPNPMLYHAEVVWRRDAGKGGEWERVGEVRVGSYGHTLGGAVGLAMITANGDQVVNKAYLENSEWEVEIANGRYPAKLSLNPLYDPKNLKIKA